MLSGFQGTKSPYGCGGEGAIVYIVWTILVILLIMLVPMIEIAILIGVGTRIGTGWTIAIVLGTAVLGGLFLALYGRDLIVEVREEISQGHFPGNRMIDGSLAVVGSILLIMPGFLTDIAGIVLLLPPTRFMIGKKAQHWLERYIYIDF